MACIKLIQPMHVAEIAKKSKIVLAARQSHRRIPSTISSALVLMGCSSDMLAALMSWSASCGVDGRVDAEVAVEVCGPRETHEWHGDVSARLCILVALGSTAHCRLFRLEETREAIAGPQRPRYPAVPLGRREGAAPADVGTYPAAFAARHFPRHLMQRLVLMVLWSQQWHSGECC